MHLNQNTLLRLLLIADDEVDRMTIRRSLRQARLQVETESAGSGQEGLALLRTQEFDCVFINYVLPDTNGLDLLKQMRQQGILVPVLIFTAQANERIATEALLSGASDYISKNLLTPEVVAQSIRNALRLFKIETERVAAEKALRKSEAQLREAQKMAKIGSWTFNYLTRDVSWSVISCAIPIM